MKVYFNNYRHHWLSPYTIIESKRDTSWQDAFNSGEIDMVFVPIDHAGNEVAKKDAKYFKWVDGPNNTYECDFEGMKVVEDRITSPVGHRWDDFFFNGLRVSEDFMNDRCSENF